jgi:hypothetical protein
MAAMHQGMQGGGMSMGGGMQHGEGQGHPHGQAQIDENPKK